MTLTRFILKTLAALALGLTMLPGLAAAQNGEAVKATHGDWEVRCAREDENRCVMVQVGNTADGTPVVEVRIGKLTEARTQDGKVLPAIIQIKTALGVALRAGVRVSVDGKEPRIAGFEVCLPMPNGCLVREPLSEEFLSELKAGSNAVMTFTAMQRGDVSANISLKGFTKAFKAL